MPIHPNSQHPPDPIAGLSSRIAELERQVRALSGVRSTIGDFTVEPLKFDPTQSKLVKTGGQVWSNNIWQRVKFDSTPAWDEAGLHAAVVGTYDSANDRLYAPESGLYAVFAQITWAPNPNGTRYASILLNDVEVAIFSADATPTGSTTTPISCELNVLEGDYIELWGFQSSGGSAVLTLTQPHYNFLSWRHVATLQA